MPEGEKTISECSPIFAAALITSHVFRMDAYHSVVRRSGIRHSDVERLVSPYSALSVAFGDSSPRGGAKACRKAGCHGCTAQPSLNEAPSDEGAGTKCLRERRLFPSAHLYLQPHLSLCTWSKGTHIAAAFDGAAFDTATLNDSYHLIQPSQSPSVTAPPEGEPRRVEKLAATDTPPNLP